MIDKATSTIDKSDKGLSIDEARLHVNKGSNKDRKTHVPLFLLLLSLKQIIQRHREHSREMKNNRDPIQAGSNQKKKLEMDCDDGLWWKCELLPIGAFNGLLVGFGQTDNYFYNDHAEQSYIAHRLLFKSSAQSALLSLSS